MIYSPLWGGGEQRQSYKIVSFSSNIMEGTLKCVINMCFSFYFHLFQLIYKIISPFHFVFCYFCSFHFFNLPELTPFPFFYLHIFVYDANSFIYGVILVPCQLIRDRVSFSAALLHLVRSQGQDVHDDVQTVAECAARQGQQIQFVTLCFGLYIFFLLPHMG